MKYNDFNFADFFEINMIKDYNSLKMRKITVNEIEFLKRNFTDVNSSILEIMCGYGRLANSLVDSGYCNIEGIDINTFKFIPEFKKFKFYNEDFFSWNSLHNYDGIYSLYNSYYNYTEFLNVINRSLGNLKKNGLLIIDIFSKEWREKLPLHTHKVLYEDENIIIELSRDFVLENEISSYRVINKLTKEVKCYKFSQCTIYKDVLENILPSDCDFVITNSEYEGTRDDNEKHIVLLRKRG